MHTLDNVPHTCIIELAAAAAAPGFTHETPGNLPGKAGRTYARAKDGHGHTAGANDAVQPCKQGDRAATGRRSAAGVRAWECGGASHQTHPVSPRPQRCRYVASVSSNVP
jgi:hypothetical protein